MRTARILFTTALHSLSQLTGFPVSTKFASFAASCELNSNRFRCDSSYAWQYTSPCNADALCNASPPSSITTTTNGGGTVDIAWTAGTMTCGQSPGSGGAFSSWLVKYDANGGANPSTVLACTNAPLNARGTTTCSSSLTVSAGMTFSVTEICSNADGNSDTTVGPSTGGPIGCVLPFPYGMPRTLYTFISVPSNIVPAVVGCTGIPTSFSISPALPAGLAFDAATNAITGKPTVAAGATTYLLTPINAGGHGTPVTWTMTVVDHNTVTCGGGATNADGVNADKEGLLSFFVSTNGHKWTNKANWGVGDCCSTTTVWYTSSASNPLCSGGRVTNLNLNGNMVRMLCT